MPVRPPSLRSIAAFEAAARHSSFTKAADELNLTPGAVSHAIKALEQRLGCRLFDRSSRVVTLTTEGQRLAARVRLGLNLLSDAFEVAPWRARDRLVISTLASIAQKILIPALGEIEAACPGTAFDIRSSNALADVDGEIDVAIRFGPGRWRGVQTRFLGDEQLFPVVSAASPGERPQAESDLARHRLIDHPESSWRLWLDPNAPFPASESLHIDDSLVALEAAAAGHGIALARGRLVERDLAEGRLVRVLDRAVAAEYGYWAVWSGSSSKRELIERFVDATTAIFNR